MAITSSRLALLAALAVVTGTAMTYMAPAEAAPSITNTTLTINKGGDRTAPQAVSGLNGATFDFYEGTQGGPPPAAGSPGAVASCVTAGTGTCEVDLPGRTGGAGNGTLGYWIVERTAAPAFTIPTTIDVGPVPTTATVYNGIFTGNVNNNVAYTFPQASTNNNNLQARGNIMADIRDNPPLPGDCGLNIALLIDVSNSIGGDLPTVKSAANGFVDALTGTPSTIALYSFATDAAANLGPTAVSTQVSADTVKAAVNALTLPGGQAGGTNWDAGLFQIAAAATTFDAVVMLTDGNPTFYGPPVAAGPGSQTRFREVENGIFSANALKLLPTRVVAVGVGSGISGSTDNLKAISGPTAGSDYVQTDYAALGAVFREIALRTCAGTISVVKKVLSPTGDIASAVPAGGWTFTTATGGVTPTSGETAGGTGAVSFNANLNGAPSLPVTITETPQLGYTFVQATPGQNAVCTVDGAPVTSTSDGPYGFTVDALQNKIVSCIVYNRAPAPPASVQVNKSWNINGTLYPESGLSLPPEFRAFLELTGQTNPAFGQPYGGYLEGDEVTVGETVDEARLPVGCTNTASGDIGPHTLAADLNTFAILNTVTCVTRLTMFKEIVNPFGPPQAALTEWTLNAYPPASIVPIVTGTTGATGLVSADVKYSLGETPVVAGYAQEVVQGAVIVAPSTGSWHCVLRLRDGTASNEFDGLNGSVTIEIGRHAECTAKNLPIAPKLTLHKQVTNSHGGTAVPTDWLLHADPATKLTGAVPISGRDGEPEVTNVDTVPHVVYQLFESDGPANYEQVGVPQCVVTGTQTPVPTPGNALTLGFGDNVTCTFVNQDLVPPPLLPTPSATPGPDLPATGTKIGTMLQGGGLMVLAGIGLVSLGRWRRNRGL